MSVKQSELEGRAQRNSTTYAEAAGKATWGGIGGNPANQTDIAVVVSSGENANGKWRIWSDGTIEQWGYSGANVQPIPFAIPFTVAPVKEDVYLSQQWNNSSTAPASNYLYVSAATTTDFTRGASNAVPVKWHVRGK